MARDDYTRHVLEKDKAFRQEVFFIPTHISSCGIPPVYRVLLHSFIA